MTFPADLRPDEVHEQTGIEIPDGDDYDTAAGLVLMRLGRMPVVGDEIELDDGSRLRVERLDGRRISRLRYLGPPTPEPENENPEASPSGTETEAPR
jgi:CBS domain containing-hemolysin-like protein